MMKRFLSLVLCLCLMCTASIAFAATETQEPDESGAFEGATVPITAIAKSTAIDQNDAVYSVEIVWGDMKFAYGYSAETTTAVWVPSEHAYTVYENDENGEVTENVASKGWYMLNEETKLNVANSAKLDDNDDFILDTQDAVMVFNHSNRAVDVKIEVEEEETTPEDLTAEFTKAGNAAASATAENTWALTAGTENNVYADDGSCVIGTVKIKESEMTSTTTLTVAKLNITITKADAA